MEQLNMRREQTGSDGEDLQFKNLGVHNWEEGGKEMQDDYLKLFQR